MLTGKGEGRYFTSLDWVKKEFEKKFGFTPYPGTLNLRLESEEDKRKFENLKRREGIKIIPPSSDYCVAECYKVKVAGKVDGVIVIPKINHYYTNIVEIVAPVQIKGKLGIQDGDFIVVEVKI